MTSLLRKSARKCWESAFLWKYRGRVSIGKDCYIPFNSFRLSANRLKIGDYVRFGERTSLWGESLTFGDHFSCGSDVTISGLATFEVGRFSSFGTRAWFLLGKGRHRIQSLSNSSFGHLPYFDSPEWKRHFDSESESRAFCTVGHDVWIGMGSIILPNLSIGHGAVVAAGSVVTQDVPPYAIVGGNPASILSFRFKQGLIQELLEMKWWDWPIDKINRNIPLFTKNLATRPSLDGLEIHA